MQWGSAHTNYINRIADGLGVDPEPEMGSVRRAGKRVSGTSSRHRRPGLSRRGRWSDYRATTGR